MPPPKTLPCRAAITGTGRRTQSYATRWKTFGTEPSSWSVNTPTPLPAPARLMMSIPEQKLGPSPWSTTARTPDSAANRSAASRMAWNSGGSSALCFSGRARVTVATWSAISTRTRSATRAGSMPGRVTVLMGPSLPPRRRGDQAAACSCQSR